MNVVLLFEGTENDPLLNPSAISELAYAYEVGGDPRRRILPESEDQLTRRLVNDVKQDQVVHLTPGSGTHGVKLSDKTGCDWALILEDHYRWLKDTLECVCADGDFRKVKLFVFGFSRGAYQAKLFVNALTYFGLDKTPEDFLRCVKAKKRELCVCRNIPTIEFVGLLDTVCSTVNCPNGWRHVGLPQTVKACRHALAIHECRSWFQPQLLVGAGRPGVVEERWFLGAHSDVGWAYNGTRFDKGNQAYTATFGRMALSWIVEHIRGQLKWNVDDLIEPKAYVLDYLNLLVTFACLVHRSYDEDSNVIGYTRLRKAGKGCLFHHSVEGLYALRNMPGFDLVVLPMMRLRNGTWNRFYPRKIRKVSLRETLGALRTLDGSVAYGLAYRSKGDVQAVMRGILRNFLFDFDRAYDLLNGAGLVNYLKCEELQYYYDYILQAMVKRTL